MEARRNLLMSEARTQSKPAELHAKTIQVRPVRAELYAGRRWKWWGKRGWWLHCSLLHEQGGTWHIRRFVATLGEACALLYIQEDDWAWQAAPPREAPEKEPKQEYIPFLMF
jgi:hypothetical protein